MKIDKTKNAKRNIGYGLINKVISLILPFVTRTVVIKTLGAEYLGLDSLFVSILQVLNITELGVSSAIVFSMYRPIVEDDDETVCALLNLYRKIYRYIGFVILIIGLMLCPFLPCMINQNPTVGGGIPKGINLYVIYIIYLVNTVIGYLLFAYKTAIPNAIQRMDIVTNVNTITTVITKFFQIFILLLIGKIDGQRSIAYYLYLLILPLCTLLNNIIISMLVSRYYPQYICCGKVSDKIKDDIKIKVVGLVINKVCATTRNALDSICISAFLGLTLTTMYNNYFYIINAITGVILIITSSILAGVGNSVVTDSRDKNYSDMRKMNFLYMWLSGWCTISMLVLFQPFMELWVGKQLMFPFGVVVCFCIYFYVLKMGDIRAVFSDAAGLWWENRYRAVAESIANIVLNIVLVQIWGIYGIIIATLISLFVINFGFGSQIVFKHYFKNGKLWQYYVDHGRYLIVTIAISLITIGTCKILNELIGIEGWMQGGGNATQTLMINAIVCMIVPNFLYFVIYKHTVVYLNSMSWFLARVKGGKRMKAFLLQKSAGTEKNMKTLD